jgi:hypothetical protein
MSQFLTPGRDKFQCFENQSQTSYMSITKLILEVNYDEKEK